jgi:hypothetical protein
MFKGGAAMPGIDTCASRVVWKRRGAATARASMPPKYAAMPSHHAVGGMRRRMDEDADKQ